MHSQGRHLKNSFTRVGEYAQGTKGEAFFPAAYRLHGEKRPVKVEGKGGGHQQEQTDFINALMAGEIYNEGEYGAKSTFTAILGREACYSGKELKWDDVLAKGKDWTPGIDKWNWKTTPPAVKGADGAYDIPKPGIYKFDEPLPAGLGVINQA